MTDKAPPADLAAMRQQVEISMRCGASALQPRVPAATARRKAGQSASRIADWSEVRRLGRGSRRLGGGVFEIARDQHAVDCRGKAG